MRNKGKTVNWREFLRVPGMRLFIRLSSICDRGTLSDAGMGLNWSCPAIAGHIRPRNRQKSTLGLLAISRHKYPPTLDVYRMKKKGRTVSWRESLMPPRMGLFTPIRPILRSRNFGENGSLGWPTHSPYRSTPPHTEDIVPICVNLTDRNWKDCVTGPTGSEPKLRERAPQETFHLVESTASFSLKLGCGLELVAENWAGYSSARRS